MAKVKNISLSSYFIQGINLINKYPIIFLISLILTEISAFIAYSQGVLEVVLLISSLILALINLAYSFSIPIFLVKVQENHPLDLKFMARKTWDNSKRLIIPGLIFILLAAIFAFFVSFVTLSFFGGQTNMNKQLIIIITSIISAIIAAFLIFMPIYFSLQNLGVVASIKQSFSFSWNNYKFIVAVFLITSIEGWLMSLLPVENLLVRMITWGIGAYFNLWLLASALFYWQKISSLKNK